MIVFFSFVSTKPALHPVIRSRKPSGDVPFHFYNSFDLFERGAFYDRFCIFDPLLIKWHLGSESRLLSTH